VLLRLGISVWRRVTEHVVEANAGIKKRTVNYTYLHASTCVKKRRTVTILPGIDKTQRSSCRK